MSGCGGPLANAIAADAELLQLSERAAWTGVLHAVRIARFATGGTGDLSPLELAAVSDCLRALKISHPKPGRATFAQREACGECGQVLPIEQQHVLGADGLPDRLSSQRSYGWPAGHLGPGFTIRVDGDPVTRCIAYDRTLGFVVLRDDSDGQVRVDGAVTIERTDPVADWKRL
ncbi:hypothetical protein FHR22_002597 [Sphingopyxis panaciterrae]|uniref:hypothetical protein n=1 Tax=Sphingopyxis panaciterrae TaxID=363841 RepID=UPI0014202A67|nr:hypothetical protein [Sphingopyxis panaciterrae]NIJ37894.1 hypothetical protein [Sphingopyxis panaciterrae]